jgi:hypothetical protein
VNPCSNKVRWSGKVAPHKIRRLYDCDARGMLDEDLLNDVGYGIYACCRDIVELAEARRGRINCRKCGNIIVRQRVNGEFDNSEVLRCNGCSWEIACGDYHKSLLSDTPADPYDAELVYGSFVEQWPLARSPSQKLLLIDGMIHEFHIHYRSVGTPLGCDVVKATAKQMIELLEGLAYSRGSARGLGEVKAVWASRLEAKRMGFTKSDLQIIARELRIKGRSRMRKRELVEAIEAVKPQYFES